MGIIRECGGKMHMHDQIWSDAATDFFEVLIERYMFAAQDMRQPLLLPGGLVGEPCMPARLHHNRTSLSSPIARLSRPTTRRA
jgi:hypothetical protein